MFNSLKKKIGYTYLTESRKRTLSMKFPQYPVNSSNKSLKYDLPGNYIDGIPIHKLQSNPKYAHLPPAIIVECGSFSPITNFHLHLFEAIRDNLMIVNEKYNIIGGIISPVHMAYGKSSLIPSEHRIQICQKAIADHPWIAVSDWEVSQDTWTPTSNVLDHIETTLKDYIPGLRLIFCMGSDVLYSFMEKDLWSEEHMHNLMTHHTLAVLERETDETLREALQNHHFIGSRLSHVHFVSLLVQNNMSSTLVRNLLKGGKSVRYLIPDAAIDYIYENKLYESVNNSPTGNTLWE